MRHSFSRPVAERLIWLLALAGILCWIAVDQPIGWDFAVIQNAMHSLREGHNPYRDGMAAQDDFLHSAGAARGEPKPFVYVYAPITLRLLQLVSRAPEKAVAAGYWSLYALMVLAQLVVARQFALPGERFCANLLLPLPIFFPGLLLFDSVLGGNIAFILFGIVLLGCWVGWRRDRWLPFYAAVLLASCFKIPYLTLLAIPLLSARRRWLPTLLAAVLGVSLFAAQALVWPALFRDYMLAVDRIFSFNDDFGSGPSGRLGAALMALHLPYALPSVLLYVATAGVVFIALLRLSRAFHAGELTQPEWIPLMMCGVLLLNPRIIEYEIFAFTFFLALVAYRVIAASGRARWIGVALFPVWIAANVMGNHSRNWWKGCECFILVILFIAGYRRLQRRVRERSRDARPVARPA